MNIKNTLALKLSSQFNATTSIAIAPKFPTEEPTVIRDVTYKPYSQSQYVTSSGSAANRADLLLIQTFVL